VKIAMKHGSTIMSHIAVRLPNGEVEKYNNGPVYSYSIFNASGVMQVYMQTVNIPGQTLVAVYPKGQWISAKEVNE